MALTEKQRRFVDEYLVDMNATQAATRAGYSAKTAYSIGQENLKKPEIAAAIAERQQVVSNKLELSAEWVLERLVENVDRALRAVAVTATEGTPTGEYKYEGNVANRALELIGKHLGMFKERVEHTGKDGGPIDTNDVTPTRRRSALALLLARPNDERS
jgi:phage terminase small subunit